MRKFSEKVILPKDLLKVHVLEKRLFHVRVSVLCRRKMPRSEYVSAQLIGLRGIVWLQRTPQETTKHNG